MKYVAGLMCLGSLYAGALWAEYQIALLLGTGCFLLVGGSALAVIPVTLGRAPGGYERLDGFHGRSRNRRASLVPQIRFSQPGRA
jgi:hypothetical protein